MKEKTYDLNKLPKNLEKEELRRRFKEEPLSVVNEWEKGRLKKLFKAYDKDKKALIRIDDLKSLFKDLMADKANLGKVPKCEEE